MTLSVAIIGAGMAGASLAAGLCGSARVTLIEREAQAGYHSTGRSAALWSATYGPVVIRALTRASRPWFDAPPPGYGDRPILTPRGEIMIARGDQAGALAEMAATLGDAMTPIGWDRACELVPVLRKGYGADALLDASAMDIDVAALHQGHLRQLRAAGGTLMLTAEVTGLLQTSAGWRVETTSGTVEAEIVVNAAGAWADAVAGLAGLRPLGLVPKRRTALTVACPPGLDPAAWPMVVDVEEAFYLKPDAGRFLISPADATPSPPCDAQPEEMDIAICMDRIGTAFDLPLTRPLSKWAGLRSFVADGEPVAGFDPRAPGFFWLAGQGGYGIQTSPALARTAASLIRGKAIPGEIAAEGVAAAALSPSRFGEAG